MKKVTKPPTLEDIRRVILAVLIMIVSPQRWTKMYWAKSPMHQTPMMPKVISRDRFWALFPLVFSWDILEGEEYFNRKFKEVYSPSSYGADVQVQGTYQKQGLHAAEEDQDGHKNIFDQ